MPYILEINGQTVILNDEDVRRIMDRLVRQTRIQVWNRVGGPDSMFSSYYHIWEQHNRCHAINIFVLTMEVLGSAHLPDASWANRLRRQQRQLERLLRPNTLARFFDRLPRFVRDQGRFVRAMQTYRSRMIDGANATVRILEITRDTSFLTLSVCATILSAGAASGAAATAATTTRALGEAAARQFLLTQIQHSATRLGRSMAGERVTARETVNDIVSTAIDSVRDAGLGAIVGHFMGPLTNQLSTYAAREVARGNILRGVAAEMSKSKIEGVLPDLINQFIQRNPREIRRLLNMCVTARDARGQANIVANGLMQNRNFRRLLEERLERVA